LLLAGVLLAVAALIPAQGIQFDRSIESMFAPDSPLLPPFARLKRTFSGSEFVIAVYRDEDFSNADQSGIRRLAKISRRLREVPGVRDVLSLDLALEKDSPQAGVTGLSEEERRELGHYDMHSGVGRKIAAAFEGLTHGANGQTAAVICMLQPEKGATEGEIPDVTRRETIAQLRQVMETLPPEFGLEPGMIAGEPVMVTDGFDFLEEDGERLSWATSILLGITILLCFHSLRWMAIPILVVQLTLLVTKAVLVWSNLQLTMVSSMLAAIVTVVGVAAVVHVAVRFLGASDRQKSPREALLTAISIVAVPVFWSCFTDGVGFFALNVAAVEPVQDFGTMMAIGATLVILTASLLIPGLTMLGRGSLHHLWDTIAGRFLRASQESAQSQPQASDSAREPLLDRALGGLSAGWNIGPGFGCRPFSWRPSSPGWAFFAGRSSPTLPAISATTAKLCSPMRLWKNTWAGPAIGASSCLPRTTSTGNISTGYSRWSSGCATRSLLMTRRSMADKRGPV
jgi:predicted RND superfamily exporter protein